MPSIHDFATWRPLLELVRDANADLLASPGGHVSGRIGRGSWSVPFIRVRPQPGRALLMDDVHVEHAAVKRVLAALKDDGRRDIAFAAEISPDGRTILYLIDLGSAVERGIGAFPGTLVLVEDSVPEPWRRAPEPVRAAPPVSSARLALLERVLRERLPDAVGATEAEIAATQARIGVELPEELRVLYRVTRARWEDWVDADAGAERLAERIGCELFDLELVYLAEPATRPSPWRFAAMEAVHTPPGAAVQGLVGSPGWIVFGDNGRGDRLAVDLTPGPGGRVGQIISLPHEESTGADVLADSLLDFVTRRFSERRHDPRGRQTPAVARINVRGLQSVEAAAHPGLEVLSIGAWDREPLSLAPVLGLPRLRTLTARPGTLADPLEIAGLTGLEFLELGSDDWRILVDAGAVPRGLSACVIEPRGKEHPTPVADLANELLVRWGRPAITQTILEGRVD